MAKGELARLGIIGTIIESVSIIILSGRESMIRIRKILVFVGVWLLFVGASSPAYSFENGTILHVADSPELYFVVNGYAAPIPSQKVFDCLGLKKNRKARISRGQLDGMPKTAFLIRGSDRQLYRVDGDYRRLVPNKKVYHKKGFNENEVIGVQDGALMCLPKGPPLH